MVINQHINTDNHALVLFSGGQDSAICLAWALKNFAHVQTIGFDYGQRHHIEIQCRQKVREEIVALPPFQNSSLGTDTLIELSSFGAMSDTALTQPYAITDTEQKTGLPNTFVPARNMLFLTYAGSYAYQNKTKNLIAGMCETDFSGYPDCRLATLTAIMHGLNLALDDELHLHTPLMHLNKANSWVFAHTLGGSALVDLICEHSHTCYEGTRDHRYEWGYGCAQCPACVLRAKGWDGYQNNTPHKS